ncbi:hypothetical protein RGUI_0388 [Rhodovulum sp. P5]|nr:hypothetical protein RGUI_0388 [Rhodovulum sp. P5]
MCVSPRADCRLRRRWLMTSGPDPAGFSPLSAPHRSPAPRRA